MDEGTNATRDAFTYQSLEISGITDCQVTPILSEDYPLPAKRPHFSLLDKSKVTEIIGPPRHWREALKDCLDRIH